jgi:hypothetical protein
MRDRYGVVNEQERDEHERMFQVPFGYKKVFWSYHEAEKECRKLGEGFVVERIFYDHDNKNKREIIYRAAAN